MPAAVVKRVKDAILYADGMIRLDHMRFSYPNVFVPKVVNGDNGEPQKKADGSIKKQFSLEVHIDKKMQREAFLLIKERKDTMLRDNKLKSFDPNRLFIKDGDNLRNQNTQELRPETAGKWVISCREEKRPLVFGPDKSPWNKDDHGDRIYGGCWGSVVVRPWFQDDKKWGKRVNCGFSIVQFWKDGEPFGQGHMSEETASEYLDEHDDADYMAGEDSGDDI